ncbi:hypothetical protein EOM39_07810, partial [Candidatus Gracilibacteria bacterium]|nr:hypothetical protein [Candidatus Gracilibacteria bacterium]
MKQKEIEKNNLDFLVTVSKFNMVLLKALDGRLGGLGFNDFIILHHLDNADGKKLKRIELAEKVGLTA